MMCLDFSGVVQGISSPDLAVFFFFFTFNGKEISSEGLLDIYISKSKIHSTFFKCPKMLYTIHL